jgi:hypothetical protein
MCDSNVGGHGHWDDGPWDYGDFWGPVVKEGVQFCGLVPTDTMRSCEPMAYQWAGFGPDTGLGLAGRDRREESWGQTGVASVAGAGALSACSSNWPSTLCNPSHRKEPGTSLDFVHKGCLYMPAR